MRTRATTLAVEIFAHLMRVLHNTYPVMLVPNVPFADIRSVLIEMPYMNSLQLWARWPNLSGDLRGALRDFCGVLLSPVKQLFSPMYVIELNGYPH